MRKYELSNKGLANAIADRHRSLRIRKGLVVTGVIILVSLINLPGGATVAFKCI